MIAIGEERLYLELGSILNVTRTSVDLYSPGADLGEGELMDGKLLREGTESGEFWLNQPERILAEDRPGCSNISWRNSGMKSFTGYQGWGILTQLTQQDSCPNWILQGSTPISLVDGRVQGSLTKAWST